MARAFASGRGGLKVVGRAQAGALMMPADGAAGGEEGGRAMVRWRKRWVKE